jgi:nucleoside-diphosphate kinase
MNVGIEVSSDGVPLLDLTLVLVKPDAVSRGLVGEIIRRIERAGMELRALSMCTPTAELARSHYENSPENLFRMGSKLVESAVLLGADLEAIFGTSDAVELGGIIHERNVQFLQSGPVVAAVIQGVNAVRKVRAICGSTMPVDAQPGSIRGDFSSIGAEQLLYTEKTVCNLVHSSDESEGAAMREIALWFPDGLTAEAR